MKKIREDQAMRRNISPDGYDLIVFYFQPLRTSSWMAVRDDPGAVVPIGSSFCRPVTTSWGTVVSKSMKGKRWWRCLLIVITRPLTSRLYLMVAQ